MEEADSPIHFQQWLALHMYYWSLESRASEGHLLPLMPLPVLRDGYGGQLRLKSFSVLGAHDARFMPKIVKEERESQCNHSVLF